MSVSAISSGGGAGYDSNGISDQIRSLQKQLTEAQKSLAEVQADKELEDDIKNQQITLYQKQIAELQAEIARLQQEQGAARQGKPVESAEQSAAQQLAEMQQQKIDEGNRATGMFGAGQYVDQDV